VACGCREAGILRGRGGSKVSKANFDEVVAKTQSGL